MWYGMNMRSQHEQPSEGGAPSLRGVGMDMRSQHEHRIGEAWPAPPPSPTAKPFSRVYVDADGYPHTDGEPMAQNTRQCDEIFYAAAALKTQHAGNPDTFVASDLLMHYRKGDRRASVAPDVFVAFGVGNHERLSYKLWEERAVPSFALEVLSGSSAVKDMVTNRALFERLGIEEYWVFDPWGNDIEGQILGLRLRGGVYQPIPPLRGRPGYHSAVLNLEFRSESGYLRIRDPETGEDLKSHQEAVEDSRRQRESRQAAELRAAEAVAARQAAEARVAELEAALGRESGGAK